MAGLLVWVFVLQLFTHLLERVGSHALNEFLWVLWSKLPAPTSQSARKCSTLRIETLRLKREMNATSAQDDFAKWAKLRRQHDKSMAEYDKASSALDSAKSRFTSIANTARWVLTSGMRFVLCFWYSRMPMFWIPRGWLPGYIEWLVAFPKAPTGSVSIVTWNLACHSALALLEELLTAASTLIMGKKLEVPVGVGGGSATAQAHAFPAADDEKRKKKEK